MLDRLRNLWLPRCCFALTVTLALALALAVGVAPSLEDAVGLSTDLQRLTGVFARDGLVRRVALVCAAGLLVTACVFFRAARQSPPPPAVAKKKRPKPSAPVHISGD